MAKDLRYDVRDPSAPMRDAAATILHGLIRRALDRAPAVLQGDDPEATHDMRVALRRLRSATRTFGACYRGEGFRAFSRAGKRLRRRLGGLRDADVQLATLQSRLERASAAEAPGIAFAIDVLRDRRRRDLARAAKAFAAFDRLSATL